MPNSRSPSPPSKARSSHPARTHNGSSHRTRAQDHPSTTDTADAHRPAVGLPGLPGLPSLPRLPLPSLDFEKLGHQLEDLVRRDETDIVLVAGNVALVALEIIEWPVAALTMAVHLLARSRFKALEAMAEVGEECE